VLAGRQHTHAGHLATFFSELLSKHDDAPSLVQNESTMRRR